MTYHYKFIDDPDTVKFFLDGIVKFTPIDELNDPSELTPNVIVQDVKASLARLRNEGYTDEDLVYLRQQGNLLQRLAPQFQAISVPSTKEQATAFIRSPFYDDTSRLEAILMQTAQEMSEKVGLFCLSLRYDPLPMWAHYAKNAAGLVIEFKNLDNVFRGDETGVLQKLVAVQYERESLGMTFDSRSHEALFFSKFQDWSYEREVRVLLPLDACTQMKINEKTLYTYKIPATCVSRIFLGWKIPAEKAENVRYQVQTLNPGVEVVEAKIVHGHVTLNPTV